MITTDSDLKKKIRVLMIAPSFDILGGQSVQAARLLTRLRDEGAIDVAFLPINPRLPGFLRWAQRIKYLRTIVTSIAYVASLLLRAYRYDVLHVFSASYFSFVLAPTPAILIGKLYGKKVLLNYHSGEAEDHLARWRRTAIPTIRLVDEVAVPSAYLVTVFAQFGLHARAINNIVEMKAFRFRERATLRPAFLSNRNLEPHYGVDRVLRAFAIVQHRFPESSLTVAGDGSQRSAIEHLARKLDLRNIRFTGRVEPEEIYAQYDAADIYLNGSEIDNQPLSLLEAFACGLPVVTTNAGGIPDIVTNGETGLVVQDRDPQSLAASAIRLLEAPELARAISARAHEMCGKYSWQTVRQQWIDLYFDVTNSASDTSTVFREVEPAPENSIASERNAVSR